MLKLFSIVRVIASEPTPTVCDESKSPPRTTATSVPFDPISTTTTVSFAEAKFFTALAVAMHSVSRARGSNPASLQTFVNLSTFALLVATQNTSSFFLQQFPSLLSQLYLIAFLRLDMRYTSLLHK